MKKHLLLPLILICGQRFANPVHAQSNYEPYFFTTLAGSPGNPGSADGTGSTAQFYLPSDVAPDGAGNIYVADTFNYTIRKISPAGVVSTLAGLAGVAGSADDTGSTARFYTPYSVTVDNGGNVYVADTYNHTIRKITSAGVVTTVAGLAGVTGSDDGTGGTARFSSPAFIAADNAGNLYVVDYGNLTIRKIAPGGVVTTLAGSVGNSGSADGTGSSARFFNPHKIAADSAGNLYLADYGNHTIRKITSAGVVTTVAGLAGVSGSADGTGGNARFFYPSGLAVDSTGNLFVAEADNSAIRKITPAGVVTTLAGLAGVTGSSEGTGNAARFRDRLRMAGDSAGRRYVADTYNHTIRLGMNTS